ncbi:MAG TPA: ABC transporter C-terminal domain-containing protein, partial [Mucilaginibacter sp.]
KNNIVAEKVEQKPQPKKNKLGFKELKELENLDKEIAEIENKIGLLTEDLNKGGNDHSKLIEIAQQIAGLNTELDGKSIRWIELTELNEA